MQEYASHSIRSRYGPAADEAAERPTRRSGLTSRDIPRIETVKNVRAPTPEIGLIFIGRHPCDPPTCTVSIEGPVAPRVLPTARANRSPTRCFRREVTH